MKQTIDAPEMLPWALYLSDHWWTIWSDWTKGLRIFVSPQMARARAVVLFDQALNGELDRMEKRA